MLTWEERQSRYKAKQSLIAERQKEKEESYQERAAVRNKKRIDYERARRSALTNSFIANNFLKLRIAECPSDIIELKRQQIQILRLTKQLNQTLQEINHE